MPKDPFDEMFKEEKYENRSEQHDLATPQSDNGHKIGTASVLASIGVVVFFIADIIALAVFAQIKPILCAVCLGLLLLLFGIIGLTQTKINWDSWPIIIFPVVGVVLIVLPITDLIYNKNTGKTIFTTENIAAMASSVFFIAGILMIIMPFLKRHFMLKKCTVPVMAKCIHIDSHISHGKHGSTRVYAPKWEYHIDGKVYEHQESSYTNVYVPSVGDEHEIFVNPDDPNQIYRNNRGTFAVLLPMGIIFAAVSVMVVYMVFFAQ